MAGEPTQRRRRGRIAVAVGAAVVVGALGLVAAVVVVGRLGQPEWGTPGDRVLSPTGDYQVVTYEWTAMIDGAWNLAIERVDGEGREWFWRSVEMPRPRKVRFTGPTTVEVVDDLDQTYRIRFDPETLEPTDRFCPTPAYCTDGPWDAYTREGP